MLRPVSGRLGIMTLRTKGKKGTFVQAFFSACPRWILLISLSHPVSLSDHTPYDHYHHKLYSTLLYSTLLYSTLLFVCLFVFLVDKIWMNNQML